MKYLSFALVALMTMTLFAAPPYHAHILQDATPLTCTVELPHLTSIAGGKCPMCGQFYYPYNGRCNSCKRVTQDVLSASLLSSLTCNVLPLTRLNATSLCEPYPLAFTPTISTRDLLGSVSYFSQGTGNLKSALANSTNKLKNDANVTYYTPITLLPLQFTPITLSFDPTKFGLNLLVAAAPVLAPVAPPAASSDSEDDSIPINHSLPQHGIVLFSSMP